MANTYTQIHIQTVFTVQDRESVIQNSWKDELYKYIAGIIKNNKHKLLAIIYRWFSSTKIKSLKGLNLQDN